MARFLLGVIIAVVAIAAGGYWFVTSGKMSAGQDVKPGPLEKWAAKRMLRAGTREARDLQSPLPASDDNLAAGIALYVSHCQVCHGGPDAVASPVAKGLTPNAPQLAKDGVEDDPEGVTYWKIAHGIRFTGMPAFRQSLSEKEMWQIALFAKHMDKLSPGLRQAWAAGRPGI
jgi:mono/diheme cytochrome c family protein